MKQVIYRPSKIQEPKIDPETGKVLEMLEVDSPFKGEVVINMPKYKDRMKLIRDSGFGESKDANGAIEEKDSTDQAIKMAEIAEQHTVSVKLVHRSSGDKFNKFEDLEYSQEGTALINDIAGQVLGGAKLGNGSKAK